MSHIPRGDYISFLLQLQVVAGVSAVCAYVSQHSVVERVNARSAWSFVCLRIDRFVQVEETVAPAFAMTVISKGRLVSFALPVPAHRYYDLSGTSK